MLQNYCDMPHGLRNRPCVIYIASYKRKFKSRELDWIASKNDMSVNLIQVGKRIPRGGSFPGGLPSFGGRFLSSLRFFGSMFLSGLRSLGLILGPRFLG